MKNTKSSYDKSKFKIPAPWWNDQLELLDRSYFISDIQDYLSILDKKRQTIVYIDR